MTPEQENLCVAELEKWKKGCEANADNLKAALRRQDEQRLEIIGLNADLGNANRDSLDYKGAYEREFQCAKERLKTVTRLQAELELKNEDLRVTNSSADFHIKECQRLREEVEKAQAARAVNAEPPRNHQSTSGTAFFPYRT